MSVAKALAYGAFNIASGCGITFANKIVLSVFDFHFVYALTLVHTLVTILGLYLFCWGGIFEEKRFAARQVAPLGCAFVGYVVFWNMSLAANSVGFYQLSKIMVMVAVAALECALTGRRLTAKEMAAMALVMAGVGLATVADTEVLTNVLGVCYSLAAIVFSAIYQVWAGTKQKELEAGSMQLMQQFTPYAAGLLAVCVPAFEPVGGLGKPEPGTLLGYPYTPLNVAAILLSAVLGLLVSWSTFLFIGATSSLTFNMVGHLKLIVVLAGGVAFFGDHMPPKKLAGVALALAGIVWYSLQGLQKKKAAAAAAPASAALEAPPSAASEAAAAPSEKAPLLEAQLVSARQRSA